MFTIEKNTHHSFKYYSLTTIISIWKTIYLKHHDHAKQDYLRIAILKWTLSFAKINFLFEIIFDDNVDKGEFRFKWIYETQVSTQETK